MGLYAAIAGAIRLRHLKKALIAIFEKNNYYTDAVYNEEDAYLYVSSILFILCIQLDLIPVLRDIRFHSLIFGIFS